jgi:acetyltransferase-like isoleucine patch superfamily enzyme
MMVHATASVSPSAIIGTHTRVWHWTQIGDLAQVGDECIVGSAVYIDRGVIIGNRVKIQTGAQLYRGTIVEDGVFIGPRACMTNDRYPRAVNPDGRLKADSDWSQGQTLVQYGASIGAGAIILADVTIGRFAMVAAGATVVEPVPNYGLVVGAPARLVGFVCTCGRRLTAAVTGSTEWACRHCEATFEYLPSGQLGLKVPIIATVAVG